jgi:hypothetical protein
LQPGQALLREKLPDRVGRYLVTQLKEDPDWVWSPKAALRPKAEEKDTLLPTAFNNWYL